jgi:hypothetical protein
MAIYKILNESGEVVNRIVADEEFMQAQYPQGNYELEPEPEQQQE